MSQPLWLPRSAWALAGAIFLLMLVSGLMVSASTGLPVPSWAAVGQREHRAAAGFVSLLALGFLWIAHRSGGSRLLRGLSVAVVIGVALQAGLGMTLAARGASAWLSLAQASLMHFVFAAALLAALLASRSASSQQELVEDEFRPSLRSMSWLPAGLIAVQVVLGSAYRHGLVGVIPHLVGAMVVAGFLALVGLLVATTYPKHPPLRRAGMALVWMMLGQVVLGVFALSYRAGSEAGSSAWDAHFVFTTVGHLLLGSLTLVACVWLALAIRWYVAGAAEAPASSHRSLSV